MTQYAIRYRFPFTLATQPTPSVPSAPDTSGTPTASSTTSFSNTSSRGRASRVSPDINCESEALWALFGKPSPTLPMFEGNRRSKQKRTSGTKVLYTKIIRATGSIFILSAGLWACMKIYPLYREHRRRRLLLTFLLLQNQLMPDEFWLPFEQGFVAQDGRSLEEDILIWCWDVCGWLIESPFLGLGPDGQAILNFLGENKTVCRHWGCVETAHIKCIDTFWKGLVRFLCFQQTKMY